MDHNYIQRQLNIFHDTTNPQAKSDALWRIASNADIFSAAELNSIDNHAMPEDKQTEITEWCFKNKFYF